MADWSKILSSGKVEDRRGQALAFGGGGLSLLGVGIVLLVNLLGGGSIDVNDILNQLPPSQQTQQGLTSEEFAGADDS